MLRHGIGGSFDELALVAVSLIGLFAALKWSGRRGSDPTVKADIVPVGGEASDGLAVGEAEEQSAATPPSLTGTA